MSALAIVIIVAGMACTFLLGVWAGVYLVTVGVDLHGAEERLCEAYPADSGDER